MTAFSLLLILVGIFIILNSGNFVKVLKGEADINFLKVSSGSPTTANPAPVQVQPGDTLGGTSSGQH